MSMYMYVCLYVCLYYDNFQKPDVSSFLVMRHILREYGSSSYAGHPINVKVMGAQNGNGEIPISAM